MRAAADGQGAAAHGRAQGGGGRRRGTERRERRPPRRPPRRAGGVRRQGNQGGPKGAGRAVGHAQGAGELIAGLDGHPSQKIARIEETGQHTIRDILEESLEHELHAVGLYKKLLEEVEDSSIYLEEYARGMIGEEEQHSLELKRMLKDYG